MLSGTFNEEGQLNCGFKARYYPVLENKTVKNKDCSLRTCSL